MKRNPFQSELSLVHSNYCLAIERDLKHSPQNPEIGRLTLEVFHELLEMIVDGQYICTGATAAFGQEAYRLGVYPELGTPEATAGLAHDLFTFLQERARLGSEFATFVAVFAGPQELDEDQFEGRLWDQLQKLHEMDAEHHGWDPEVSSDPDHPEFSYSFAGESCFIVGMHANSSRPYRRFPYPALVFNSHEQFEALRESGAYDRMKKTIREREMERVGSVNPMLADFGQRSEARQYAGRAVEEEWKCPFQARRLEGVGSADPEPAAS